MALRMPEPQERRAAGFKPESKHARGLPEFRILAGFA